MIIKLKDFYHEHRAEVLEELIDAMKLEMRGTISGPNNPKYNAAMSSACRALTKVLKFIQH